MVSGGTNNHEVSMSQDKIEINGGAAGGEAETKDIEARSGGPS